MAYCAIDPFWAELSDSRVKMKTKARAERTPTHALHRGRRPRSIGAKQSVSTPLRTLGNRAIQALLSSQRENIAAPQPERAEREADRVAAHLVPDEVPNESLTTRPSGSLSQTDRSYFEPRLGTDLDGVRLHTGSHAQAATRRLGAHAFNVGQDVYFDPDRWSPKRLAHELAHVAQRCPGSAMQERLAPDVVAGDWVIKDPDKRRPETGPTDAEILEEAFKWVCPDAWREEDRIKMDATPSAGDHGCQCLADIEQAQELDQPGFRQTPRIELDEHTWTNGILHEDHRTDIALRHPGSQIFSSGYWTENDERFTKPLGQLLAHEVCGHVWVCALTDCTERGRREDAGGHDAAIERENLVAEQRRGPDFQPRGLDIGGSSTHRGESFLQATIQGFAQGSTALPAGADEIIDETIKTIKRVPKELDFQLFVQVEGQRTAAENKSLGLERAAAVRAEIEERLKKKKKRTWEKFEYTEFGGDTTKEERFRPDLERFSSFGGAGGDDLDRAVHVYLFHRMHAQA